MTNSVDASRLVDRVAALVEAAKRAGADAADAVAVRGRSTSVSVRLGKVESDRSVGKRRRLAARLRRQAGRQRLGHGRLRPASARRARRGHGARLAGRSLSGPRRSGAAGASSRDLDLFDATEVSAERLREDALAAEEAALAVKGVTNSGGSGASAGLGGLVLATSHGFLGQYVGVALLALGQRHRRRGHRHGARLRIFLAPAFRRSRRAGRYRPQGRRARRAAPRRAQGGDRPGRRRLRSARRARHRRPSRRRHQRRLGGAQDQLPARHDGQAGRVRRHHRHRRAAAACAARPRGPSTARASRARSWSWSRRAC